MQNQPLYRFREGALDNIMRTRNFTQDAQLAAALGIDTGDIARLRAGAKVTAELAFRVAVLQDSQEYLAAYFDLAYPEKAAA